MEDDNTIEEIEELKELVPIDLLTEKERMYAVGFIEGCVWTLSNPSNVLLDNICVWLKENLNRYEYYGTIDIETLLDDFLREFSK